MEYLYLGVPSALSTALDVWAMATFRLVSGYLGVDELSALSIMMSILLLSEALGNGLDQAHCAFVGQALGAGKVELAYKFYNTFRILSTGIIFGYMLLFYCFQKQIV